MMTSEQVVEFYRSGVFTKLEAFSKIVPQISVENCDDLIGSLPIDFREAFSEWLVEHFRPDAPGELIEIGGEWQEKTAESSIRALQQWVLNHTQAST